MTDHDNYGVTFINPPPRPSSRPPSRRWVVVAAALRARPDEWALVATDRSPSISSQIKSGRISAFQPAGAFESTVRNVSRTKPARCDIYARYVGGA